MSPNVGAPSMNVPAAVTTTTGIEANVGFSSWAARNSQPDIPGIIRSSRIRKGVTPSFQRGQCRPRVGECCDLVSLRGHDVGEGVSQVVVVVHDHQGQAGRRAHRGSSTVNVEPCSGRLSTLMRPPLSLHDLLRDPETQPQSRVMCGSDGACKRTEDLALFVLRDPNPMVANNDDGLRRLDADRNLDGAPGPVLERVRDQVRNNLIDASGIPYPRRRVRRVHVHRDMAPLNLEIEPVEYLTDDIAQIDRAEAQLEPTAGDS